MIELSFSRIAEPKTLTLYHAYVPGLTYSFAPGHFVDTRQPSDLNDIYRFTSAGDKIDFSREVCDPFGNKWCQHSKVTAHLTMGNQTSVGATTGNYARLAATYPIGVGEFGSMSAPSTWGDATSTPKFYERGACIPGGARSVQNIVAYPKTTGIGETQGVVDLEVPSFQWLKTLVDSRQKVAYMTYGLQYATRVLPGAMHGPVVCFGSTLKFSKSGYNASYPARCFSAYFSMRVWDDTVDAYGRPGCYSWDPLSRTWLQSVARDVLSNATLFGRRVDELAAFRWLVSVCPEFGQLTTPDSCTEAVEKFLSKHVPRLCGEAFLAMPPSVSNLKGSGTQSIMVGSAGPNYEQRQAARDEARSVLGSMAVAARTYVGKGLTSVHEWNLLGNQAIDNMASFSSNLLAYAGDLKKVGDSIKSLIEVGTNPTDPKAWASLWLSSRFGDKLTIRDTRELMKAISAASAGLSEKKFFKTSHSMELNPIEIIPRSIWTSGIRYNWYKVYYWPRDYVPLMKTARELMEWDAWPTLENTWDMIPLSFVVDWFFNVSELLASIDRCVYKMYVSVVSVLKTEKDSFACDINFINSHLKLSTASQVSCSVYLRRRTSYLDYEPLSWFVGSPSTINIVDAASLLIQLGKLA